MFLLIPQCAHARAHAYMCALFTQMYEYAGVSVRAYVCVYSYIQRSFICSCEAPLLLCPFRAYSPMMIGVLYMRIIRLFGYTRIRNSSHITSCMVNRGTRCTYVAVRQLSPCPRLISSLLTHANPSRLDWNSELTWGLGPPRLRTGRKTQSAPSTGFAFAFRPLAATAPARCHAVLACYTQRERERERLYLLSNSVCAHSFMQCSVHTCGPTTISVLYCTIFPLSPQTSTHAVPPIHAPPSPCAALQPS